MSVPSLEELSILASIKGYKKSLRITRKALKKSKKQLEEYRHKVFAIKHGISPKKVIHDYAELLDSCCYQGGQGYELWMDLHSYFKRKLWISHQVVHPDKYHLCQPTPEVYEAYLLLYGKPMVVTKKMHWEVWGN